MVVDISISLEPQEQGERRLRGQRIASAVAARRATAGEFLLTCASGFVAVHVLTELLQLGYKACGTVRSKDKGEVLDRMFTSNWGRVQWGETDGALDEAVKGLDAITHTGSYITAVNGTVHVLKSALLEPKIKRVVITSSFAAILNPEPPVSTFTEKDWNHISLEEVEKKGAETDAFHSYRASKTLAEKAAWKFVEDHTKYGVAPFDLATINPPLIFGPILHDVKSAASLNTSVGAFYAFLTGAKKDDDAMAPLGSYIDVRDVAKLHVDALSIEEAGGKRFAASSGSFYYQLALDTLHAPSNSDLLLQFPKAVAGHPHATAPVQNVLDASRAKELFNWTPIPFEKTFTDMAVSLAETNGVG
ncbi:hypothetical protein P7C70_g6524, partial [Phenoliferia sp. Uapishka_3]